MDGRGVLLIGACLGAIGLAACTAPDPGEVVFSERRVEGAGGPGAPGGSSGTNGPGPGGAADGGGDASVEGGAAVDPVFGDSPFVAGAAPRNANGANANHMNNVEAKDCIVAGCHLDNAKKWGFAGTVYNAGSGGQTVAGAEVRVTAPDGALVGSTYTDANGNFWFDGPRPPPNSRAGVRKDALKRVMSGTIGGDPGAACNAPACHGGQMARIFLN